MFIFKRYKIKFINDKLNGNKISPKLVSWIVYF